MGRHVCSLNVFETVAVRSAWGEKRNTNQVERGTRNTEEKSKEKTLKDTIKRTLTDVYTIYVTYNYNTQDVYIIYTCLCIVYMVRGYRSDCAACP